MRLHVFQLSLTTADAVAVKTGVSSHDSGRPSETPIRAEEKHAVVKGKQLFPGAVPQSHCRVVVGTAKRVDGREHAQQPTLHKGAVGAMAQKDLDSTSADALD